MQELWQSIINLPYTLLYLALDLLQWIVNLLSPADATFTLQSYFDVLPIELLQLLGYCNVYQALTMISTSLGLRGILMIFGR